MAITKDQQAVEINDRLADGEAALFEPQLARSLLRLAVRLYRIDEEKDSLLDALRTAESFERLMAFEPQRLGPEADAKAEQVRNVVVSRDKGDIAKALDASLRAVEIFERLATVSRSGFEQDLVGSLGVLKSILIDVSEVGGAIDASVIFRALKCRERLAIAKPDEFGPALASDLLDFAVMFSKMDEWSTAVDLARRAADQFESLAATDLSKFGDDLVLSLSILLAYLGIVGDKVASLETAQRAAAIAIHLAETEPDRFKPLVLKSLTGLAIAALDNGEVQLAAGAITETLEVGWPLAKAFPEHFLQFFQALQIAGPIYRAAGREDDAKYVEDSLDRLRHDVTTQSNSPIDTNE